jgi:hypothetical protein
MNKENQKVEKIQKQIVFNNLAMRNHLFFLKYLLAPAWRVPVAWSPVREHSMQPGSTSSVPPYRHPPFTQVGWKIPLTNTFSGSWRFLNKRNNKFSEKQVPAWSSVVLPTMQVPNKIISKFSNSKNKINNHLKYLYFSSKIFSINRLLGQFDYNQRNYLSSESSLTNFRTKSFWFIEI